MFHYIYVGYFDPLDTVDITDRPFRPKPQRPFREPSLSSCLLARSRKSRDASGMTIAVTSAANGTGESRSSTSRSLSRNRRTRS
jgi:hypothetical protein